MLNRLGIVLIGLLSAGLLVVATASGGPERAGAETITLYSGQHEQTVSLLVAGFEKQTGIQVKVRSGDEADLANQIIQEGSHSPADAFYTENSPALTVLDQHGLLAKVPASTLAAVHASDSSPDHDWLGISARESVMVYNTKQVTAGSLPKTLLGLEAKKWAGKIGFAPGETDFQPLITAIVKLDGQAAAVQWLKALKADGKVYPDNETLVAAVNSGQVAVGLIEHYYWYRLRDELGASKIHSALAYFAPRDPGSLVDISGAGVLKSSDHQAAANKFLAFLVSAAGQRIIATSHSYEYPLRAGVTDPRLRRPFSALKPPNVTVGDLGNGQQALALLQEVGLL